jgi:MoaA/NifB/PqqE/SkfB family radical SAM enzyme
VANVSVLPNNFLKSRAGKLLTFVVPAHAGCDLRCPFCLISQRRENTQPHLQPDDYSHFIRQIAASEEICALAIQGHEPLLPSSIAFTQSILATGRLLGLPTGLVTNGTHLYQTADLLRVLQPTQVTISLDSSDPDIHDKLRGRRGAWATTLEGIKRAREVLHPSIGLAVASVLFPRDYGRLGDMPRLLAGLGIKYWILNPLIRIGRGPSDSAAFLPKELGEILMRLHRAAVEENVNFIVDDELNILESSPAWSEIKKTLKCKIRVLLPEITILRLLPDGNCSTDCDILEPLSDLSAKWVPASEDASDFIRRLCRSSAASG